MNRSKLYQTPESTYSRKSSSKCRQPLDIISDNSFFDQNKISRLQEKVYKIESRMKNLQNYQSNYDANILSCKYQHENKPLSPFSCSNYASSNKKSPFANHSKFRNMLLNSSIKKSSNHEAAQRMSIFDGIRTKMRRFKDQDDLNTAVQKIKHYCQENYDECYDFYKCQDIVALKYLIYVLYQELDAQYQKNKQLEANPVESSTISYSNNNNNMTYCQIKRLIEDSSTILEDIICEMKSMHFPNGGLLQNLNNQVKKLRHFDKENKSPELKPQPNHQLHKLQNENKQLHEELNYQLTQQHSLNQKIKDLNLTFDKVLESNNQLKLENEKHHDTSQNLQLQLNLAEDHKIQLANQVEQLQFQLTQSENNVHALKNAQRVIEQEYEQLSQMIQNNDSTDKLQIQIKDQTRIIVTPIHSYPSKQLLIEEAQYLGSISLFAADILMRHPNEGIPTTLVMLQNDLANKKPIIQQKLQVLNQMVFGTSEQDINLLENLQCSNRSLPEITEKYEKVSFESNEATMNMLLVQCQTIEKLIQE